MRVLHVAAGNLYGGVERILVELARHTGAVTHEFALAFDGRLSSELAAAGATVHRIGDVKFSRPLSTWRARRRLAAVAARRGDTAVVCHAPWSYAVAAPAIAARPVLWAHDASNGEHWTERRVASRPPALVICNSRHTELALSRWLADARREVIYAPVSTAPPHRPRAEMRASVGAADTTVVIAIACRFERWKGHAELLRAAAGLPGDWAIWIAGGVQRPHEAEYEAELRALAAASGIASRVIFLGERHDVPELLRAADIHCQPNTAPEPFGLAFVEALNAALPVVTSTGGGASEIVTPACGVLVPPTDSAALRAALAALVADPARRRALGEAGPGRAHELCDPRRQIARLESVLRDVTAGVHA